MKIRENNYDLLRAICCIAVVVRHTSDVYIDASTDISLFGFLYISKAACIYNALVCVAVPCFFMLCGAFELSKNEMDYKSYYSQKLHKIGIPAMVFGVAYIAFEELQEIWTIVKSGGGYYGLLEPIKNALLGRPYYHMWYISTMIILWIAIPWVADICNRLRKRKFLAISIIYLLIASVSYTLSTHEAWWDIGLAAECMSYCFMGCALRDYTYSKKNNKKGIVILACGLLICILIGLARYGQELKNIADTDLKYQYMSFLNLPNALASVLIFTGFSYLNIRKINIISNIAKYSLYIYLIHAFFVSIIRKIIICKYPGNAVYMIPLYSMIVFVLSYIGALIYVYLHKKITLKLSAGR